MGLLRRIRPVAFFAVCLVTIVTGILAAVDDPAGATPPQLPAPAPEASASPGVPGAPAAKGDFFTGINRRDQLLGDLFGLRPFLSKYGITIAASETSEVLGNVTGGFRQGFAYDGLTQADLQLDTQRAFGLRGGTFNVSALQIHGSNLSANNLGTLQTASGIESDPATRLWELWYQQRLRSDGRLDVKIGQQSLDQEFMVSQNALLFVNTMFGWPLVPSADLPGGGPAYPLSALGVRFRAQPTDSLTVLGGVFNGSPVSANLGGDPQVANPSGTSFPLDGGVLAIGELQYTYPVVGGIVYGDKPEPLARTIKLGFWYDSETFSDLALDTNRVPLVSPASNGVPLTHQGNYSVYATLDQLLYQKQGDPYRTLSAFARVMGDPLGASNLVEFSMNAGLTLHEPIPHRRDDTLGIGMGYGRVGTGAMAADQYTAQYVDPSNPIRTGETFLEATYQYELYPWIQLQPDFQYVFNPGAGIQNPNAPFQRVQNEAVIGIRAIIQL
jgi:porin